MLQSARTLVFLCSCALATAALADDVAVLHVYNWSDYIAEDTIAKFEQATGIKVVYDVYERTRPWRPSCLRATAVTTWCFPRPNPLPSAMSRASSTCP